MKKCDRRAYRFTLLVRDTFYPPQHRIKWLSYVRYLLIMRTT
jgi:hypothetical protein